MPSIWWKSMPLFVKWMLFEYKLYWNNDMKAYYSNNPESLQN